MDVVVHPEDDSLVYLTYSKPKTCEGEEGSTVALARGRLKGGALTQARDIFVADGWEKGVTASRLLWAPDGTLFMTVGGAMRSYDVAGPPDGCRRVRRGHAQDPGTHFGKLLRLKDDGTAAADNPFAGREGYLPEIYSMGHRNQIGLAHHPDTGQLWATRARCAGGRRSQHYRTGGQLRVADRNVQPRILRPPDRRHPEAAGVHSPRADVVAVDRTLRSDLLHRQALPEVARKPVRGLDDGRANAADGTPRAGGLQSPWARKSDGSGCSPISSSGSGTSPRARTGFCTC